MWNSQPLPQVGQGVLYGLWVGGLGGGAFLSPFMLGVGVILDGISHSGFFFLMNDRSAF